MGMTVTYYQAGKRTSVKWRQAQKEWSEFCACCSRPKRTGETYAVYLGMNKESQGDLKDVGGFVGAMLNGPRRTKASVTGRTMVTLDLDETAGHSAPEVAAMVRTAFPTTAFLIYSTHKHCDSKPRLRVVVPLDRIAPVQTHEAAARMFAKTCGILDMCDPTTFDPCRMFYWPSASRDGDWFCDYNAEGDPLKAVDMLGRYSDWTDQAQWPRVPGEGESRAQRSVRGGSLQDPLEKTGIVGEFCRAYSPIELGIELLLADVYQRGKGRRYTYIGGSTSSGVELYDLGDGINRWAYSNHATDPASGVECNIFDLVRMHRYLHLDEGSKAEGEKLPSYEAMVKFAQGDERCQQRAYQERMAAFEHMTETDPDADEDAAKKPKKTKRTDPKDSPKDFKWKAKMEMGKDHKPLPNQRNILLILRNDPELKDMIAMNDLTMQVCKTRESSVLGSAGGWRDTDDSRLRIYFETMYDITARDKIYDAVEQVSSERHFHPIRDYLNSLPPWDPKEESLAETVFIRALGVEDSPLNRAMSRKWLAGAVKRVMEPGCKMDYCLLLTGPEGIGKSTVLRTLASDEYFTDSLYSLDGKDAMEQIVGQWIVELSEMAAASKSDQNRTKQLITQQIDRFRAAYGRRTANHPRQCVFAGTSNEDMPLRGDTGNRRFWLLPCTRYRTWSIEHVRENRDRIWAEALHLYRQGEKLYLEDDLERQARERQKEHNIESESPIVPMLCGFLEQPIPACWADWDLYQRRRYYAGEENTDFMEMKPRTVFSACEFLCERMCYDIGVGKYMEISHKVGKLMAEMPGWERQKSPSRHTLKIYGSAQRYWVKTSRYDKDL